MSKLSLQFHALPGETLVLVRGLFEDPAVRVVEMSGLPPRFKELQGRGHGLENDDQLRALIFTMSEPVLEAKSLHDFLRLNPSALTLEIGRLSSSGLSESWLAAMTDDKVAMTRWRKIARTIKDAMMSGAVAESPKTGATVPMKEHRFTAGAQAAYADGVAILPFAGNSIIRLPRD